MNRRGLLIGFLLVALVVCCSVALLLYMRLRRIDSAISVDPYLFCLYEHIGNRGEGNPIARLQAGIEACAPFEQKFCQGVGRESGPGGSGQHESFDVADDLPYGEGD